MLEEFRGEGIPVAQENKKGLVIGLKYGQSEELWKVYQIKRRSIKQLAACIMVKAVLRSQFHHFPAA